MKKIAKFEKVTFNQFKEDALSSNFKAEECYANIKLPTRATKGSAGYDFFAPFSFSLNPNQTIIIPTGIRVKIEEGWVLKCYPRSGLGFKYSLQLNNTVGIIDADYYFSKNQGHIMAKITNRTLEEKILTINCGEGFMQGVFVEFGITIDDVCERERDGGFGSTTNA
ncbi:MAG: dUTP diphosphatase [Anaerotignaceae bacterium]